MLTWRHHWERVELVVILEQLLNFGQILQRNPKHYILPLSHLTVHLP